MAKHSDQFLSSFGARVREYRLEAGISQEQLAHEAGVDRTYVGGVERGQYNPSLLIIKRLADALSVHPRDFLVDAE